MASLPNQPKKLKKRKKIRKVVATTLDEAYLMYMKMFNNKPPTASRFKKFINGEKRVQMGILDFVTCDKYLRTTGRGRKSSGLSTSNKSSSRRKLNTRTKSKDFTSSTQKPKPIINKKHKRSTKSVDYKDEDKYTSKKKYSNKSRAEKPVSISSLTNTKIYKNKYGGNKSSIGKRQKPYKRGNNNNNINSKKNKKNKTKKNTRKNGVSVIPLHANINMIRGQVEHVDIPNDIDHLISTLPDSPILTGRSGIKNIKSIDNKSMLVIHTMNGSNDLNLLKSFPFFEHMTLDECARLKINDKIDHRYSDGQYLVATILAKMGSKVKLNYDKYGPYQTKHDIWSDYKYEIFRFAKWHSITIRPGHRMMHINIGSFVDINPKRHTKKSHRGWKTGEVIKRDYKSGQIKIEYGYKTRKCIWWTHLDNIKEIASLGAMIGKGNKNMNKSVKNHNVSVGNIIDIPDMKLNDKHDEIGNKALEFAKRFAVLNLDTSLIEDNGILERDRSGYIDDHSPMDKKMVDFCINLDFKNIKKWSCDEIIYWFGIIDNGRFGNDSEYEELNNSLRNYSVNGKDLLQFNDVFLRMVGVGDEYDRKIILDNIKKIAPKVKIKNGHKRNLSQVEIDKGIKKATEKYVKQKKELKSKIVELEQSNETIRNQHEKKLSEFEKLEREFKTVQKKKTIEKKQMEEIIKLKNENCKMNEALIDMRDSLTQTTKQLNNRNDELILLRKKITSLNKEIINKDEKISIIKTESLQKICKLKKELANMANKYAELNRNDTTKESMNEYNNKMFRDDNKYNFDNNNEINTPDSPQSESVSVVSVNSPSPDTYNTPINHHGSDPHGTIIIDNGSETIKIGYGSTDVSEGHKPSHKFHSIIGMAKHNNIFGDKGLYIGDDAYNKSSILDIKDVIYRGDIMDWEAMEQLWDYTFYNKLSIPKNKTSMNNINILLTESLCREKKNREKSIQLMFEKYDINSMFMINQAVLSLYGCGKITGNALGIGYGVTYSASIYEGMVLPKTIIRVNSSGYDLTKYLKQILCEKYSSILKMTTHNIFRDMKQKYCFVADNFHESLKNNVNSYKKYKLPDGQSIRIGNERFRTTEQLFCGFINLNNEEMLKDTKKLFNRNNAFDKSGIHHMINTSINLVNDSDLQTELYSNIILSGGSTMFKGLSERLHNEVNKLTNYKKEINIIANDKRKYLPWIGGSIVSSLSNYMENFIQRNEYEEEGPRIVHTKCPL